MGCLYLWRKHSGLRMILAMWFCNTAKICHCLIDRQPFISAPHQCWKWTPVKSRNECRASLQQFTNTITDITIIIILIVAVIIIIIIIIRILLDGGSHTQYGPLCFYFWLIVLNSWVSQWRTSVDCWWEPLQARCPSCPPYHVVKGTKPHKRLLVAADINS